MTFAWQWEKLRANLSVERQLPLTMATEELTSSIYTLYNVDCRTTGIYEARYLETIFNQNPSCKYSCRFIVEVQEDRQHSLVESFSMFRKFHVVDNVLMWEQTQITIVFSFGEELHLTLRMVAECAEIYYSSFCWRASKECLNHKTGHA